MAAPSHKPDKLSRDTVTLHATVGTTQANIARLLGIDEKTLRKHYRDELDLSLAQANATIGGNLFNKAKGGDTACMIFWMKTQAGWRETTHLEHTSPDGSMTPAPTLDVSKLSAAALNEILAARTDK
jgi:hypothetical protein